MKKMEEPHWCLHVELKFKWYDIWVGGFIDVKDKAVYICLIPMFPVKVYVRLEGRQEGKMKKKMG